MSRIRSRNTKPELLVRTYLHKKGYRFRLNGKISKKDFLKGILPGKPDIVLKKYKIVIFINGCFWHGHKNCKRSSIPNTNTEYWKKKILNNVQRDKMNYTLLTQDGWDVIILWECEIHSKVFRDLLDIRIHDTIIRQ